jgi:hypothetical protein
LSRGVELSRYITLAKPRAIIGEASLRRKLASEVILQSKESEIIPTAASVDVVLASAPVPVADTYTSVDGDAPAKRRRGRPKKVLINANADVEKPADETDSAPVVPVRRSTHSKKT